MDRLGCSGMPAGLAVPPSSGSVQPADAAIACNRGPWWTMPRAATAQAVFARFCGTNAAIGRLAALAIASRSGTCGTTSTANDQAVLDRSCAVKLRGSKRRADDAIAARRGRCSKVRRAHDQTVLDRACAPNCGIARREYAAIDGSTGMCATARRANDHGVAASSGGRKSAQTCNHHAMNASIGEWSMGSGAKDHATLAMPWVPKIGLRRDSIQQRRGRHSAGGARPGRA